MKTVTDSLFRHTQEQTDTASIAALSWREIFTDSQLQQLIDTGLKNNTDLNIARLKVKEAEAVHIYVWTDGTVRQKLCL